MGTILEWQDGQDLDVDFWNDAAKFDVRLGEMIEIHKEAINSAWDVLPQSIRDEVSFRDDSPFAYLKDLRFNIDW